MTKQEINWTAIRHLLDRFYDGTTTQDEERYLMEVLTGDDVPETLEVDAEVFRTMAAEADRQQEEPVMPEGLEQRLMERIQQEEATSLAPVIPLKPSMTGPWYRWWTVAAACLLVIIFSVPCMLHHFETDELYASSDISQQEAEEYADYALAMISSHLKAGVQELEEVSRVQEQIRTSLNEIAY